MAYALTPCKAYALNEFRLSGEGSLSVPEELWREKDATSIHCATTLGVLYDTLASGKQETERLSLLTAQLTSVIKRRLNAAEQRKTASNVTIHGVSALAIIAGYQGNYNHWQMHMKGLMRLLELVGEQDRLDVRIINTIRKADFTGAISSATKPCIPFARLHHELLVPPMVYDAAMIRAIQQHLQACALDPATVKTIADLALFNRYMDYLTMTGSSSKHDTQTVIEEYYFLKHQLLCVPRPLREPNETISANTTNRNSRTDIIVAAHTRPNTRSSMRKRTHGYPAPANENHPGMPPSTTATRERDGRSEDSAAGAISCSPTDPDAALDMYYRTLFLLA
ncbi:hypothetical protein PG993_004300 [Apiospora rasikravindrae]|uniref:Uncharacterized protein n=1 Tax=Apiospora rasikravindrae TaxID=990691 RepID=A0ABR1TCE0_9PEZI